MGAESKFMGIKAKVTETVSKSCLVLPTRMYQLTTILYIYGLSVLPRTYEAQNSGKHVLS